MRARDATSTSPTCSNAGRPATARPSRGEVDACRPYLDRQIELIRPKLIVALGKSAATTLLDVDATIASLRGRVHRYRGVPLIVTYHPAYLLRNLPDKAKAWEDLLPRAGNASRSARRRRLAKRGGGPQIKAGGQACPRNAPRTAIARVATLGGNGMRKNSGLATAVFAAVFATLLLSGCGYNDLQRQDEGSQGRRGPRC